MGNVATVGDAINTFTTSSNYCSYTYSYSCNCDENGCSTCWATEYTAASGSGTVSGGSSNVFVNGKKASHQSATTNEKAQCPSPYSGTTTGSGAISTGVSNVYVNGKPIAITGSKITTHTGNNSSITGGSSNVHAGG